MKEATKAMNRRKKLPRYQEYFTGHGVDIGCGDDCIIAHADSFPILSCKEYDLNQGNAETCQNLRDQSFDFLHSSHCLEHLPNPIRGMLNWIRVVKVGGYLVITVPDEHMYEKDVWPSRMNSQHYWSFRYGGFNERKTSVDVLAFFDRFVDVEVVTIKRISENYYESEDDLTKVLEPPIECALEIVLRKVAHNYKPVEDWALNGFCFMLNSLAMGDVIAAVPIVKYMIERYYSDASMYRVVAKEMFRDLFWFVPDSNFHNFEDNTDGNWGIPANWALGVLNQKQAKGVTIIRNTPKAMHLSQFAAFKLVDMMLTPDLFKYIPLPEVDISHFEHDFSKSVIMVSSYRDDTRMWKAEFMLALAVWIQKQGYEPVFIGKTDMNLDSHLVPKTSLPQNLDGLGLDLRNKTTMSELATIIGKSVAIVGLDSGPIHLAGCTQTPIVCGYTTVDPQYRIPIRDVGDTYVVEPDVHCKFCESKWAAHFHNYEKCYFGADPQCCNEMTANKFIVCLKEIFAKTPKE